MSKAQPNNSGVVFDFNNEQFLNLLLEQTEQQLIELQPHDKKIVVLEQRKEFLIEKLNENGYPVPGEKKSSRRAA